MVGEAMQRPFPLTTMVTANRPERALAFVKVHDGLGFKLVLATLGAVSAKDKDLPPQLLQCEVADWGSWEWLAAGGARRAV
jgi:hypothetical protein